MGVLVVFHGFSFPKGGTRGSEDTCLRGAGALQERQRVKVNLLPSNTPVSMQGGLSLTLHSWVLSAVPCLGTTYVTVLVISVQ